MPEGGHVLSRGFPLDVRSSRNHQGVHNLHSYRPFRSWTGLPSGGTKNAGSKGKNDDQRTRKPCSRFLNQSDKQGCAAGVRGRMTTGKATLFGTGSGVWLGLLIGLIFGLLTPAPA